MTGCWSSIRACMLHYAAWLLCHTTSHVTRGTLHGTHYTLHGTRYTLHGTRYMSRDARYTIHTIRRAMHRRQCHVTGHVVNPNTKPCNFSPDSSYSHRGKRIVPSMVKCYWYRHIAAVCRSRDLDCYRWISIDIWCMRGAAADMWRGPVTSL